MDDNAPLPATGTRLPAAPAALAGARPADDDTDLVEAIRRQLEAMLPDAPPASEPAPDAPDADPIATALAEFARDIPDAELPRLGPPAPNDAAREPEDADADARTEGLLGELNRLWRRGAN